MAFRRREQDRSSPSLGYRISSNRQPGIEQANNRMTDRDRFLNRSSSFLNPHLGGSERYYGPSGGRPPPSGGRPPWTGPRETTPGSTTKGPIGIEGGGNYMDLHPHWLDQRVPHPNNPRLPNPLDDPEYINPILPYPLEEREYKPAGVGHEQMPYKETDTAGLWQTWQKIKDRIGEDAANEWLTSQQSTYANRGGIMSLRR